MVMSEWECATDTGVPRLENSPWNSNWLIAMVAASRRDDSRLPARAVPTRPEITRDATMPNTLGASPPARV